MLEDIKAIKAIARDVKVFNLNVNNESNEKYSEEAHKLNLKRPNMKYVI